MSDQEDGKHRGEGREGNRVHKRKKEKNSAVQLQRVEAKGRNRTPSRNAVGYHGRTNLQVLCNINNSRCRHSQEDDKHQAIDDGFDRPVRDVTKNA